MANYEDMEFDSIMGENKDAKYPDKCPFCYASNPSNADTCANCEEAFEPVNDESEREIDETDSTEEYSNLNNQEEGI